MGQRGRTGGSWNGSSAHRSTSLRPAEWGEYAHRRSRRQEPLIALARSGEITKLEAWTRRSMVETYGLKRTDASTMNIYPALSAWRRRESFADETLTCFSDGLAPLRSTLVAAIGYLICELKHCVPPSCTTREVNISHAQRLFRDLPYVEATTLGTAFSGTRIP